MLQEPLKGTNFNLEHRTANEASPAIATKLLYSAYLEGPEDEGGESRSLNGWDYLLGPRHQDCRAPRDAGHEVLQCQDM